MKTTLKSNIMKTTLLMLLFFGVLSTNAQTTHHLDWEMGANGPEMDLIIDMGDTVIWTWTDAVPHTVQNVVGSSVETFNSGTLTGVSQTYSRTFTVEGDNDYFCGVHGAASMSGTITVQSSSTTHHLDWFAGIGSNADLTIESGDTVIWTWTDALPHTVQNVVGSSVETFNSGTLTGASQTYSRTFTVEGDNDYFCGIHGATSMSGTITVVASSLSVLDTDLAHFRIASNPTNAILTINLPLTVESGQLVIHDMLGKQVMFQDFIETQKLNIDVASLKQGLYLVSIKSGNKQQTQRFIKN
jgi:plastocyanin